MGRQIIRTETEGWTPAMKRRLLIAVVLVIIAALAVFFVHPELLGLKSAHAVVPVTKTPLVTWTQAPVRLPGATEVPAQPR